MHNFKLPIINVSKTKTGIAVYFSEAAMKYINTKEIVIKTTPELKISLPSVDSANFQKITHNTTHIYGFNYENILGKYLIEGEGEDCFLIEKISDIDEC